MPFHIQPHSILELSDCYITGHVFSHVAKQLALIQPNTVMHVWHADCLNHHMETDPHEVKTQSQTTTHTGIGWQAPLVDLLVIAQSQLKVITVILVLILCLGATRYAATPYAYRATSIAVLMPREKHVYDVSVNTGSIETTEDAAKRQSTGTLMLPSQPELYLTLLRSRPVMRSLAERFQDHMTQPLTPQNSDELVHAIRDMIKLDGSEEGLLTVTVTSNDPSLAADLANAVIEEGERASKSIERQLLLQQAGYIDEAKSASSKMLKDTEHQLKQFTGQHTIINPQAQATDRIIQMRQVIGTKDQLERDLARRRYSYIDTDPEIQRLIAEIAECDKQIESLNARGLGKVALNEVGSIAVDYDGLIERVRYQRDLVSSLTTQAEVFRIRAEQPAGSIAMIHPAVPDHRPAGPSKKKFLLIHLGLGLFVSLGVAIVRHQWRIARHDPYVAQRLKQLRPFWLSYLGINRSGVQA